MSGVDIVTFGCRLNALESGMIRRAALLDLIDDEQAGREDRSRQLWQLLTLELWHRHARSLGVAGLPHHRRKR